MKIESVVDFLEDYIEQEVRKRVKENKVGNMVENYVDLENNLTLISDLFDLTPNSVKSKLETIGVLKFDKNKNRYTAFGEKSKYINNRIYVDKKALSQIVKLKFVVETAETIGFEKLSDNYNKNKETHILAIYRLVNADYKRKLEEIKSIIDILSISLDNKD